MRRAACFGLSWKVGVLVLAMSPYRCAGQVLTCTADYDSFFQSGHLLLRGDTLHIVATVKPQESYVIVVFPQYRLAPGSDQGWRGFSVTPTFENTDYVLPGRQKIVCSWVQTPILGTAVITATLSVPYDAMNINMPDGEYAVRYFVSLEQNGKVLQTIKKDVDFYSLLVKSGRTGRIEKLYNVEAPAPPAP